MKSFDSLPGRLTDFFLTALILTSGLPWVNISYGAGPALSRSADNLASKTAAALYEGIHTETLPNGLRIYLKPVPESPVVTTMVAYKVGSADEDLDHTGLSHYLEHLMFKGTEKIMPGDIDRLTLRNGGANNAYTSEDFTVYHFDFAADRWEFALAIEADRMRHLRIDAQHEFMQEKGAVIEELQRDEDQPWDLEQKAILPLLFGKEAPYGHPVIGEREHVQQATSAVIKAHYDRWYYPNNAALIVCGGFDPDKAMIRIREVFGPLPRGNLPTRKVAVPVSRKQEVHKQIESKFDVPRMLMGFNTVKIGDPDFYPLELIQAVLTGGKTGRLYKTLVEGKEIAGAVDSSNSAGRFPGWFMLQVELLKGKNRDQAEQLVLKELERLQTQPISAAELNRAKQGILASTVFARESVHGLADSIARGVTTTDLDYLRNYLPRIQAVSASQVQETARKFFDSEKRVVVWSVPQGGRAGIGHDADNSTRPGAPRKLNRSETSKNSQSPGGFSLQHAHRTRLSNGLTILLFEDHRLPIVVAEAYVENARLDEPDHKAGVAALMGRLLDEGTARHSGPEIAELIENVGGALSLTSNGGAIKVLTPDRHLGLELLFECLLQPSFPRKEFDRERNRLLSQIDDAEHQPETKASMVYRELAYGSHPFGRPAQGKRVTVEGLAPEDCRNFHRRLFLPNNTIIAVVGDFDRESLIQEIGGLTANWASGKPPTIEVPPVSRPTKFVQKILTMPAAVQLHFFMGHAGIARDNPDYYKLLVMDYVLGTGPGFTDRLSARLRDREGLAYTVSANISSSATEQPGLFTCYIGTDPTNFARVKGSFLQELSRIREQPPSGKEVEDAKQYLIGNLPFHFTTTGSIAAQLLYVERFKLGFDYLEHYRKAVATVTPEDVQQVARKYIDPLRMVLVAAGPVDSQGKTLKK